MKVATIARNILSARGSRNRRLTTIKGATTEMSKTAHGRSSNHQYWQELGHEKCDPGKVAENTSHTMALRIARAVRSRICRASPRVTALDTTNQPRRHPPLTVLRKVPSSEGRGKVAFPGET